MIFEEDRSASVVAVGLFLIALVLRLAHLYDGSGNPTFVDPIVDSNTYHRLASGFAAGRGLNDEYFWQPFFYPMLLSLIYSVVGPSILTVKLLQAAVGAATCVLTWRLGERIFDRRTGVAAGLIVAFYGPSIFFDTELLATGWAAFWSVALLLLVLQAAHADRSRTWLALGLVGGLSVLTRPTFLPFLLFACGWLLVRAARRDGAGPSKLLIRGLVVIAGFVALALPTAMLSLTYSERFSFLPASAGINLYVGNNPDTSRTLAIRPGSEWQALTRLPEEHGVLHKRDTSSFFRGEVLRYLGDDPAGFLRGLSIKTLQLVGPRELPRNFDIYAHREWSRVLRMLVWKVGGFGFPFGVLFPLALLGGIVGLRRLPLPVWAFLLLYSASIVLVFVTSRYRTPLVPVLAVLAAVGGEALLRMLRRRQWRLLRTAAMVTLPLVVVTTLAGPFPQERTDYTAEMFHLVGTQRLGRGDVEGAVELLERALERQPSHADANSSIGSAYLRMRRLDLAREHFERAIEANPRSPTPRDNLARLLAARGDPDKAALQYRIVLQLDPKNTDAALRLAKILLATGHAEEAVFHLEQALRVRPQDTQIGRELARARDAASAAAGRGSGPPSRP